MSTPSAPDVQAAIASGVSALPSVGKPLRTAISGAGMVAVRSLTAGFASILPAWFRVMPVTANSSIPIRQIAALIQCH
jgi:hypothetical protein